MEQQLADRVLQIKPSATLAISARANELRSSGVDVINLGVGEPDFDTPEHIKQAGIKAINDGKSKYTAVDGIPELKHAIVDKLMRDNQLQFTTEQVLVSCGAKHSLYNLFQALLNPGDEVIIPAPYWVSYPDMALLAKAKPVIIETQEDNNFKISAEQLSAAITDKTRLLILNSPSNPTGMLYSHEEYEALGKVLRDEPQVTIASDDIYEYIQWSGRPFANIINLCPDLADQAVVINGVSKAYAMTGWRIGYAAGPESLIKAMKKIQSQSTSNPCAIAQYAAAEAIGGPQAEVQEMVHLFKQRHDHTHALLDAVDNISCRPGMGAFYLFPNMKAAIAKLGLSSDVELVEYLLNEAHVATVPGTAFGAPGFIRLSYATSEKILSKAIERIDRAINK